MGEGCSKCDTLIARHFCADIFRSGCLSTDLHNETVVNTI